MLFSTQELKSEISPAFKFHRLMLYLSSRYTSKIWNMSIDEGLEEVP